MSMDRITGRTIRQMENELVHTYNNGIKCYASSINDTALKRYKKYINLHEPLEEAVFQHIFVNSKIVTFVDVGAAWGYYSLLAKSINPSTRVVAFEPLPERCKDFSRNMQLNHVSGIDIRNEAVGLGLCPGTTLQQLIFEIGDIHLIKMDIQGAGTAALLSASSDITRIKNILIGTHGSEHQDCLEILMQNNFAVNINLTAQEIPLQPDGLIWASHD